MSKTLRGAARLAILGALVASPSFAHVTLEAGQAPANATYKGVFRVPHGCEGAATTRITIRLPEGVTGARPMPKPGWTLTTERRAEAPAPSGHGAAPEIASVTWEGGRLEDAHYDEFVVRFRLPDGPGETVWIPVVQDCEGGRSTAWAEVPAEGRRLSDYRHPATAVRLLPRN